MKNIIRIFVFLFASLLVFSCRNEDVPEDIHEHEEIEKMEITLTEVGHPDHVHVINYIGGVADHALHLENGKSYLVELDFQVKHDDHYHSAMDEIDEEKEEHFVTFEFSGVDVTVKRNADDIARADGTKLGISTTWTVNSVPTSAKAGIKLHHGATSVDMNFPSAENQQGKATGGESDVNALIDIE